MGAIVHAVTNRVLIDHTAKNIFGNVNYSKIFLKGTVVGVFNGSAPGGKNAIWKLTVNFEMPSNNLGAKVELKRVTVHRQHCILGPVPAGKNPPCSITFTDSIGNPDYALKGSRTYHPNTEERAVASSAIPSVDANANANAASAAPRVLLSSANDEIGVILPPPPPLPPTDASPHAVGKTKNGRHRCSNTNSQEDHSTQARQLELPQSGKVQHQGLHEAFYLRLQRVHAHHRCHAEAVLVLQPTDGGGERLLRQAYRVAS